LFVTGMFFKRWWIW